MRNPFKKHNCFILFLALSCYSYGQTTQKNGTGSNTTTVSAGKEYKTSSFHQWLWGKNYRKEWAVPVRVPVIALEHINGGLVPVKAGGGHQTKSLQVENKAGNKYAFRTVNKTLGKVLPKEFQNTFIETIVNDKVSMSHPYGAGGVPVMAKAANLYHTNPQFVYLPKQPALDTFDKFGDNLYLYEQKIDGEWKNAENLGNFEKYTGTFKVLDKMYEDNDYQADQKTFVRARLFDMLINDWDRHEDQWEWGVVENKDTKLFVPVAQDRDQAFFKYNGMLLKLLIGASGMKYFQSFGKTLPDVNSFNFEMRFLDRFFSNELSLNDWQVEAKQLQQSLTDKIIEASVQQMPSEAYAISGKEIIENLKSRRNQLVNFATTYYKFLAEEVDVTGSKGKEHFEVNNVNDNETTVSIFKITDKGNVKDKPFYQRTFRSNETNEIRLYGLSGNDTYNVTGNGNNRIKVRLIGGDERDSITAASKGNTHIYDDHLNTFNTGSNAKLHISNDTGVHSFLYASYRYNKSGFKPEIFYNNEDKIYVGLGYGITNYKWRRFPFASRHDFKVHYSISQKAFSFTYSSLFPKVVAGWDLALYGNYDAVRWTHFWGLGNETQFVIKDINFYRARTEEWMGSVGILRKFQHNIVRLNTYYQKVRIINDEERFVAKGVFPANTNIYANNNFGGAQLLYNYSNVNDSIVPTKGLLFSGAAAYIQNLDKTSRRVGRYTGDVQLFVPLIPKFSLAIGAGGGTVTGTPEFYQNVSIGGGPNVRGLRPDRFWGKSAFYNSNEIRFISKVRSYVFNGRAGLAAFYDQGRVWVPGEKSDIWHSGYGGALLLAPFDKIFGEVSYGISKEEKLIQLRFIKAF